MAVFAAVAFATLLLEDNHFVALYKGGGYFTYHFGAFDGGCAYLYGAVYVGQEHAVKLYGLTLLNLFAQVVYIQETVFLGLELLSLDFYDNVHVIREL